MLPFVDQLVCAEENELLAKLRSQGEPMRYEPSLRVFHARRAAPRSFARQMFKYGRGRGQLVARRPSTLRAAYLAPVALLVYLLLVPALIAAGGRAALVLSPVAVYLALASATALRIAWTLGRLADAPLAAALIPTVHLSYGAGVVRGLLSRTRKGEEGATPWTAPFSIETAPARRGQDRG